MTYLVEIQESLIHIKEEASIVSEKEVKQFFTQTIFWKIQKAIICGEHYHPLGKDSLSSIQTLLLDIETLLSPTGTVKFRLSSRAWKDVDETILYKNIRLFYKRYLVNFSTLISAAESSLNNLLEGRDGILIDTKKFQGYYLLQDFSVLLEQNDEIEKKVYNYNILIANLQLAYIDDYLECSEEAISLLQNIQAFLGEAFPVEIELNEIRIALLQKAKFMEYKILYRNYRLTKESNPAATALPDIEGLNVFTPFIEKIEKHYNTDFSPVELLRQIESITPATIEKSGLKLEPFHHLNRYYSKFKISEYTSSHEGISRLKHKLDGLNEIISTLSVYDRIAFLSVYKLISNTSLKLHLDLEACHLHKKVVSNIELFLKNEELDDIQAMNDLFLQIENVASSFSFPDYYCYMLYLKYLNELLEYLISNPSSIITTPIAEMEDSKIQIRISRLLAIIQNHYNKVVVTLRQNLSKMMTHKVKPVYLTLEECKVDCVLTEDNLRVNRKLFLDSSYILPLNFERVLYNIQTWESFLSPQLNILKDSIEIFLNQEGLKRTIASLENKSIDSQAALSKQIEESKTSFDSRVKENEFKLVQIVAMFVSIATFVLINVKIFDNKSALESFGILLGLAACFYLFNLFFHIIILSQFKEQKAKQLGKNAFRYFILPVCFMVIALILLYAENGKTAKNIKDINQRIDSIVVNQRPSRVEFINLKIDTQLRVMTADTIPIKDKTKKVGE